MQNRLKKRIRFRGLLQTSINLLPKNVWCSAFIYIGKYLYCAYIINAVFRLGSVEIIYRLYLILGFSENPSDLCKY